MTTKRRAREPKAGQKRITIPLDVETYSAAVSAAAEDSRLLAAWVRVAIREKLAREEQDRRRREMDRAGNGEGEDAA